MPFSHLHPSSRRQPDQVFLAGGAALCALATLVLLLQPQAELLALHRRLATGCALAAMVFGWLSRPTAPLAQRDRVLLASMVGIGLVTTLAWQLGTGLRTIALAILPLLVGLSTLLAGGWHAVLVTTLAAVCIALLAWHDQQAGREALVAAVNRLTLASGVWSHLLMVMGGLVFGVVARSLAQRWRSLADAREQQFRELLATAADHYIELDAELRFAHSTIDIPSPAGPLPPSFIGRHPWDTPGLRFDGDNATAHREDLLAHRPFAIEITSQLDPLAPAARLAISGRPRWSGSGQFLGYWCVGRNITARARQQAAAARAVAEAEAASRAKSSFLANMSHEIRTPLNGIIGLAHLARQHVDERQRLVEYLDLIGGSASSLHATLSNVLDLSRAEAGRLEVRQERVDLPALLGDLHRAFTALCRARGLACTLHIDPALPLRVQTDALRLRQILTNYLHNALKFTSSGGIGLVATFNAPAALRLEVHDSGCGIAEADQAQLFEPFMQVDASSQRLHGGSGLGLSICRELAQALGGRVGMSSQPAQGSRFWVELPLVAVDEASEAGPPAAPSATPPALPPLRVLVAEDNPVNMLITVALLEDWGLQVTQVGHGGAAVEAVAAAQQAGLPFDVVLMDLQMPELDGIAATRNIRAGGGRLPIVALTATELASDQAEARAAGFDAVLAKPVDAEQLQALLARVPAGRLGPATVDPSV